jgi:hypothetical protein
MIGETLSDALLNEHVKLDLLFANKVCGHMAFGHVGGADYGEARGRTIVGSGKTPQEAARALLERNPPHLRPKSLRSAVWALEQHAALTAGVFGG